MTNYVRYRFEGAELWGQTVVSSPTIMMREACMYMCACMHATFATECTHPKSRVVSAPNIDSILCLCKVHLLARVSLYIDIYIFPIHRHIYIFHIWTFHVQCWHGISEAPFVYLPGRSECDSKMYFTSFSSCGQKNPTINFNVQCLPPPFSGGRDALGVPRATLVTPTQAA